MNEVTFEDWMQWGIDSRWISKPFCYTHDSPELTDSEAEAWELGNDDCLWTVRLREDEEEDANVSSE